MASGRRDRHARRCPDDRRELDRPFAIGASPTLAPTKWEEPSEPVYRRGHLAPDRGTIHPRPEPKPLAPEPTLQRAEPDSGTRRAALIVGRSSETLSLAGRPHCRRLRQSADLTRPGFSSVTLTMTWPEASREESKVPFRPFSGSWRKAQEYAELSRSQGRAPNGFSCASWCGGAPDGDPVLCPGLPPTGTPLVIGASAATSARIETPCPACWTLLRSNGGPTPCAVIRQPHQPKADRDHPGRMGPPTFRGPGRASPKLTYRSR